jgi:hypothetical protein
MTDVPPPPASEPPPPPAPGTPGAPVTPPPYAPPATPGAKGPIGQARPVGMTILLSIVTCGIYWLYWVYVTFEELKQHNNKGLGGVVALLIGIVFSPVLFFILPAELKTTYDEDGRSSPVEPIIGLWVLLPIVGFIIWQLKVQGALNDYWVSKGATPAA